jgi:acyl carrier protein
MENKIIKILKSTKPNIDFSKNNKKLIKESVLDSFDIVTIISEIEKEFNISIKANDITAKNFDSVSKIIKLIKKYN